jgi:opacity protein-like surface antigen
MKKALLTLAVAMMALTMGAQAQENNNSKWVAGGTGHLSFNTDKTAGVESLKSTDMRIEPFVGYNINDRWRVGLTFGYLFNHTKELDATTGNLIDLGNKNGYRVGPYVHYNLIHYKRWIFFLEAEALFTYYPKYMAANISGSMPPAPGTTPPTYDVKRTSFDLTLKPGLTFVLNEHVNIDFNLNLLGFVYRNYKETRLDTNVETTHADGGLQLDILEGSLENYWREIAIGVTFKF